MSSFYESLTGGNSGYGPGLDSMYNNSFSDTLVTDTSSALDTFTPAPAMYNNTRDWISDVHAVTGVNNPFSNSGFYTDYGSFADYSNDYGDFDTADYEFDFGDEPYEGWSDDNLITGDWDDLTSMANSLNLSEGDNIVATYNDLSSLDGGIELQSLEKAGVELYNSDGSINEDLDTNTAIAKLEAAVLDTENGLSHEERTEMTQTRNELVNAAEAGLDQITINDMDEQQDMMVHTRNDYMYKNPKVSTGAKEGIPLLGSYIKRNQNYNKDGEIGAGYVSPDGKFVMSDAMAAAMPTSNSKLLYGDGNITNTAPRPGQTVDLAQARRQVADSMGKPNLFDRSGQVVENRMGFNNYFDSFTDTLGNVATTVLSPLNFVTDTVGGGIRKFGNALGNNFIGTGISNLGGFIDGTGDFVFNTVPNTVINYPDNAVNMLTGAGRALMGTDMGIGHPSNSDLFMGGLKGLFTDPLVLAGDALSFPLSLAVDVLGVDELSFGSKGGGGGGGGKKKPKKKARKNVPIVKGTGKMKSNGSSTGGTGSSAVSAAMPGGGSVVSVGDDSYDLSTADGQQSYVDDTGSYEALMEALNRTGESYLLGSGVEGKDKPFKAGAADKSGIKDNAMANQGNPSATRRMAAPKNPIDVYAGKEDPDAMNADSKATKATSLGDIFKNPVQTDIDDMVPEDEED